jgi:hypothetical protein
MMITPGKKNLLPIILLENTLKNFEIAFGISIDYYISDHNLKRQQQVDKLIEEPISRR